MNIKRTLIALLLILALGVSSCGKSVVAKAAELSGKTERKTTEEGRVTDAFKEAFSDFSFTLSLQTEKEEKAGNKLISPLSAALCLSLVANGAEGETKAEMEKLLGLPAEELNPAFYAYASMLTAQNDAKMELANSVWFRNSDDKLHVRDEFLQTLADWYRAEAFAAPFDDSTCQDLNSWVSKHTDGMIEKLVEGPIDPNTMMYLVNALVFDAKWVEQYENGQVRELQFNNEDGSQTRVTGLNSMEELYLSAPGISGVAKPYQGGFYFVGLLPEDEKETLPSLLARLSGKVWNDMWNDRSFMPVKTVIPEFKIEDKTELNDILSALGMKKAFSPAAEFLPMAEYAGQSLYVSGVVQKTFLELDRSGTRAAAVTAASMATKGAAPVFEKEVILDRPFVYMIVDAAFGLPLFIGTVKNL